MPPEPPRPTPFPIPPIFSLFSLLFSHFLLSFPSPLLHPSHPLSVISSSLHFYPSDSNPHPFFSSFYYFRFSLSFFSLFPPQPASFSHSLLLIPSFTLCLGFGTQCSHSSLTHSFIFAFFPIFPSFSTPFLNGCP
ncbi:hypothetical protein SISNIDRAFT_32112 [Sistotremastrum niveocremeum HHB9708]|uniref:REJ domain-containing protein n=1 Tax=Sistotremastrum niveocremeum HHB9708 TaxID=1314777 RepID=A0A164W786_9AGAM|nr:hypothetical protein SISNIDRAFT_32112 [Sistotremastrum niveocremeum HHB9708]